MNTENLPPQNIESETNKLNSELNLTTDKKQNSRKKLYIVIFICLAVVGFSVAGYLYVSNSHKIKNTNQEY